MPQRLHWPFGDPAAFVGSAEDKMNKFREVRDQIDRRVQEWLAQQDTGWPA
jgi:arsenate reductase